MKFKWYGTASLLLESGGTRILFDPYLRSYARGAPLPLRETRTADAVFITHPHPDHFADIDAFSAGSLPVYVSRGGIGTARRNGLRAECMRPVAAGDRVTIGALTVCAYPSRHCKYDVPTVLRILFSPRTWLRAADCLALLREAKRFPAGEKDVLAYSVSDGKKTALIFGSAGMERGADYPKGADLLVFPYQGRADMDRAIVPFLTELVPRRVTIDHFDDAFPPVTHRVRTAGFVGTVKKHLPSADAFVPERGEWYEI